MAEDHFVAVCNATIQPRKGHDLLVDALPGILDCAPNVHLYLAGKNDSPWAEALRARAEASAVRNHVHFLGPRDDALALAYAADLLVMPSRSEAMPLVLLEAMLLGTPVLAANVSGATELVENGESGLLFSAGDASEFSEAFRRLHPDVGLRRKMAERGLERYRQNFTRSHQIRRYCDLLQRLGVAS